MFDDILLGSEEVFDGEGYEVGFPDDLKELFEKDPDDALSDIDFGDWEDPDESEDDDFQGDFGLNASESVGIEEPPPDVTDHFKVSSGEFRKYNARPVCGTRLFGAPSFKKQ